MSAKCERGSAAFDSAKAAPVLEPDTDHRCFSIFLLSGLQMRHTTNFLRQGESRATMVEYGLLVGLVPLVLALGATVLGQDISTIFNKIGTYPASLPISA